MPPDRTRFLACLLGALAVLLGAFGAHALRGHVEPELLTTWKTATSYHLAHAIALLGLAHPRSGGAARLIVAGTVVFSGSLYLLVLTGVRWLGAITPLGGILLIAGWLTAAWAFRPGRPGWERQA